MYRNCIFCSADLKANDVLERFPVGRSVAFDAARGRLWAVCPACARWNLAPLDERWEAIEDAERLFRDTRTRAQRENIGLAKLRDGTRLVRVGSAVPGELALWRYGETLERRRRRYLLIGGGVAVAAGALSLAGVMSAGTGLAWLWYARYGLRRAGSNRIVYHTQPRDGASPQRVRQRDLREAWLQESRGQVELHIPTVMQHGSRPGARRVVNVSARPLVLRGDEVRMALGRAMVAVNRCGAERGEVESALRVLSSAGSPGELLAQTARRRLLLNGGIIAHPDTRWLATADEQRAQQPNPVTSLALEMALHEETERQALEGELAALEEMWRQAEEIAAIADRLPDDVPPSDPPRT
jgi:hypothetical protein